MAPKRAVVWGGVTLGLAGTWLGHTGEYVRVWGPRGLTTELIGSVHVYMIPLAIVLGAAGLLLAAQLWSVWTQLGRHLDSARRMLRAALRGRAVPAPPRAGAWMPSLSSRLLIAWPALTVLQLALYVIQENIEAAAAGMPAPGLGAITGVHAFAPLVHAVVALALLLTVLVALRVIRIRARHVEAVQAILRHVLAVRRSRGASAIPSARAARTPSQLFGHDLLQRPPPLIAAL
ncbi:MAG: hypothetical protein JOZ46_09285 [Candidatus Dormibacteraeota bacterium]|nr:hypothetical protein [Candidatus Dormibacteraeota bacterium]MBV9525991.1 hypothetical protein [Candidatus Dormibacteraeota bacterium]